MANQEDLAALFSRNLSLHPYVAPVPETKPEAPFAYSISQHYTHSAHLVAQQPSRPASEPPQTDQLTTEIILSRHGVDYATLFPSQIDLFKTADAGQQMRLIELWRISPPNYGGHALAQDLSSATSFEQEETLAKLRYERQMMEERASRTGDSGMDMEDTMSDGSSTTMPMTPVQQGDSRWAGVEPYMVSGYMASGYEALAQREYEQSARPSADAASHFGTAVGGRTYNSHSDPVYKTIEDIHKYPNVGGDWRQLVEEQKQQAMENQYTRVLRLHMVIC